MTKKEIDFNDYVEYKENNDYSLYIIAQALICIGKDWQLKDLNQIANKVLNTYGGTLEIAIIDYFRNKHA